MPWPVSAELRDLAEHTLEQAVRSIAEGDHLVPLAFTEGHDGRALHKFVGATPAESLADGRNIIRHKAPSIARYCLAFDGRNPGSGQRFNGIFIEAGESNMPNAVVFCQRFRPKGLLMKFKLISDMVQLGNEVPNLLAPPGPPADKTP